MGHAEIAKAPGQGGDDGQEAIATCFPEHRRAIGHLLDAVGVHAGAGDAEEGEEAGDIFCVIHHGLEAAGGQGAGNEDHR